MLSFLHDIEDNIKYKKDGIKDILRSLASQDKYKPIGMCFTSEEADDWPHELAQALKAAFTDMAYAVEAEEYAPFSAALCELGHSTADKELERLKYYCAIIGKLYTEHYDVLKTQNKIYRALGLSAGIALGIILM